MPPEPRPPDESLSAIEGAWLRLRHIEARDLPQIMAWLEEPEVLHWWDDAQPDLDAARAEFVAPDSDGPRHGYIIEDLAAKGRGLGYIQWWQRSYDEEDAWWAGVDIFIGEPDARDRGVGTEAVRMLLAYLFEERRLHRVTIDPEVANARAIRSYQKAGFRLDGVLRHNEFIRGEYVDTQMLSILEDEWPAAKAAWEAVRR